MNFKCPCCSGKLYIECCQLYHEGKLPPNALHLMRSRYSAYALKLPYYIMETTHPSSPHFKRETLQWIQDIMAFCEGTQFEKLGIQGFQDGEQTAFVTFTAHLKQESQDATFTEKSRFQKVNEKWLYLDGKYS